MRTSIGFVSLLLPLLASCTSPHSFGPTKQLAAHIENLPKVQEALGTPVSVSLVVSKSFKRYDPIQRTRLGEDNFSLLTWAKGPKGEAWVRASGQNVGGQGWAGTWSVEMDGQKVLQNGSYTMVGGGKLASGSFAADGSPQ